MKINHTEVVKKLIGEIEPVGETNEDDRRYENLEDLICLVDNLIEEITDVAIYNKNRVEHSMKKAGLLAYNFINSINRVDD